MLRVTRFVDLSGCRAGLLSSSVPSDSPLLRDVQQLNIAETSQVLRISEENVKSRLSRARLQMRDALAPGFGAALNQTASSITANTAQS